MDVVYSFVESIHVFIPVIAVISCIFIIFCCGVRGSQQPPEDYLEKIKKLDDRPKRKSKAKPSKVGFVLPSSGPRQPGAVEENLRQRATVSGKEQVKKKISDEEQPATENWVEVPKKKRKEKKAPSGPASDSAEEQAPAVSPIVSPAEIISVASTATSEKHAPQPSASTSPVKSPAAAEEPENDGFDQPRKRKNKQKSEPSSHAKAAAAEEKSSTETKPTVASSATSKQKKAPEAASISPPDSITPEPEHDVTGHHLGAAARNGAGKATPDETSSTASQKSSTSTSTSSNKTFEKVPLHGGDETPLEEETADDDFVIISPRRSELPTASTENKNAAASSKKAKKKANKKTADASPEFVIETYVPAIRHHNLQPEPEIEETRPEEIIEEAVASISATEAVEEFEGDGAESDSEEKAARKKKKKKKPSKKQLGAAASGAAAAQDSDLDVDDSGGLGDVKAVDDIDSDDGAAQKKKRRARRDV